MVDEVKLSQLPGGQAIAPISGTITLDGAVIGGNIPEAAAFTTVAGNSFNALPLSSPTADSGNTSVVIGTDAMKNFIVSAAYNNVAIGGQALEGTAASVTADAVSNIAIGFQVMQPITTGSSNIGIGAYSLNFLTAGVGNTAIGYATLGNTLTTGNNNTCIGSAAAMNYSGSNNTVIGFNVGITQVCTGSGNILIGCSETLDVSAPTSSNTLKIGNSSTPVISATAINTTPIITLGGGTTISGDLTVSTKNIVTDTSTGTKIGTAANQKISFYNKTPIVQPTTTGTTTGFTAATGTPVLSGSTFTGNTGSAAYTLGDIVNALKLLGLLAA